MADEVQCTKMYNAVGSLKYRRKLHAKGRASGEHRMDKDDMWVLVDDRPIVCNAKQQKARPADYGPTQ